MQFNVNFSVDFGVKIINYEHRVYTHIINSVGINLKELWVRSRNVWNFAQSSLKNGRL